MLHLSVIDYLIFIGYLAMVVTVSILFRAKRFQHMFGEVKKPGLLLLAASLLMIEWSPMTDMMSMGLILDQGYSGLWMLKGRFWLAGLPAILYATMWSRLKFQTDNELIRLRFSGRPGIFLHIFRAIFLALFVIPLVGSFLILALRKLLEVLQINALIDVEIILIVGVLLLVLKNSFHQKIRTDCIHASICLIAPVIICFFLVRHYGGLANIYQTLTISAPQTIKLIPAIGDPGNSSSLADFLVFLFIQWWSVHIVDNSDPNAQRHFQAQNQFAAFKALFAPIVITSLMFLFISTIWDCGLLEYRLQEHGTIDNEAFYLHVALKYLPDGCKAIVLLAILFSFITTLESIVNWGGGLITVDIIKKYLYTSGTDRQYTVLSFGAMLLVSSLSLLFAFNNDSILHLQKFIFSISAGVAPVFMLRWFWWRINAWTQIAAMLSSLFYTLLYEHLYLHSLLIQSSLEYLGTATGLSPYPLKLIILTILVVATWLTVMYCTAPDDLTQLQEFVSQTGTGGVWPKGFPETGYGMGRRLALCLLFAIASILPFLFIWQFKFGDHGVGTAMVLAFCILVIFVYRSMALLIKDTCAC